MLVAKIASEYKAPGSEPVSFSDQRAIKAQEWVEKEVDKLMNNIMAISKRNQTSGRQEVTFGELFYTYQDISDTLVGIMVRAKKRGLIEYEGEGGHMLLQGRHDKVIVKVTELGENSIGGRSPVSNDATPKPLEEVKVTALPPKPHIDTQKVVETKEIKVDLVVPSKVTQQIPAKVEPVQKVDPKPVVSKAPVEVSKPTSPEPESSIKETKSEPPIKNEAKAAPIPAAATTTAPTPIQAPAPKAANNEPLTEEIKSIEPSPTPKDAESDKPSVVVECESKKDDENFAKPIVAALPQRTNGGTRGAIIYAPKKAEATAEALKNISTKPEPVNAAAKAEWTQKHIRRLSGEGLIKPATVHAIASNVDTKVSNTVQTKGKSAIPTGMRKFAWD